MDTVLRFIFGVEGFLFVIVGEIDAGWRGLTRFRGTGYGAGFRPPSKDAPSGSGAIPTSQRRDVGHPADGSGQGERFAQARITHPLR